MMTDRLLEYDNNLLSSQGFLCFNSIPTVQQTLTSVQQTLTSCTITILCVYVSIPMLGWEEFHFPLPPSLPCMLTVHFMSCVRPFEKFTASHVTICCWCTPQRSLGTVCSVAHTTSVCSLQRIPAAPPSLIHSDWYNHNGPVHMCTFTPPLLLLYTNGYSVYCTCVCVCVCYISPHPSMISRDENLLSRLDRLRVDSVVAILFLVQTLHDKL